MKNIFRKLFYAFIPRVLQPKVRAWVTQVLRFISDFGRAQRVPKRGHSFYPEMMLEKVPENVKRIAIMAVFQPTIGKVPRYLISYINEIKSNGFYVIVINPVFSGKSQKVIQEFLGCDMFLERENLGSDFGSWVDFAHIHQQWGYEFSRYEEVIIFNDSIIGPFSSMDNIFSALRGRELDMIGLTDSYQSGYHLQSFFLFFKNDALKSGFLDKFLLCPVYYRCRDALIRNMEIGFSNLAREMGLKINAVTSYLDLETNLVDIKHRRALAVKWGYSFLFLPHNPTHIFSKPLFQSGYFPFVKKDLVENNPLKIEFATEIRESVEFKKLMTPVCIDN